MISFDIERDLHKKNILMIEKVISEKIKIKKFNEILLNSDLRNKQVLPSPKKSKSKLLPIENYINFKDSGKIPDFLM